MKKKNHQKFNSSACSTFIFKDRMKWKKKHTSYLTCDLHHRIKTSATIRKSSSESASGFFSQLDLITKTGEIENKTFKIRKLNVTNCI